MPKLICVACQRFLAPYQSGVVVEEATADGGPYKLWQADVWQCHGCGALVVAGFAEAPLAEHYQADYAATRAALPPLLRAR